MKASRLTFLFAVPLASAALYGCPGDETEAPPDELAGYEDVLYEGAATDEALLALASALEQGPPQASQSQAPILDELADGPLPKSTAPTFAWQLGATSSLDRPEIDRRSAAADPFQALRAPAARSTSWAKPLADLLGPPRTAEAHGTPFTGSATFVTFSTAANAKLVRVFTGATNYTPSAEAWTRLVGAGAPITITLIGAAYEQNRIAASGGPYQGSATTFTVAP